MAANADSASAVNVDLANSSEAAATCNKITEATIVNSSTMTEYDAKTKRKNNNWRDPRVRLITLRTIATLDLWKDVSHGKKSAHAENALRSWTLNMNAEGVPHSQVTRWQTVELQALKWVRKYVSVQKTEANKTGHGDRSDSDEEEYVEEHPCLQDLRGYFTSSTENWEESSRKMGGSQQLASDN